MPWVASWGVGFATGARVHHGEIVAAPILALDVCMLLVVAGAATTAARPGVTVSRGKIILPTLLPTSTVE